MTSAPERPPVIIGGIPTQLPDIDPDETEEWLDSLDAVIDNGGKQR
ncbi:MAG: Pyruvate dehydrogenase component, partial [Mycobacterium sp.]|nr:Pyruvate dehydrogenase component [Mycobacterium sp.]